MAAIAGPSTGRPPAPWDDQSLVAELLEALDADPHNVDAKRMLIDQYLNLGWDDAAADLARGVLTLLPGDRHALNVLKSHVGKTALAASVPPPSYSASAGASEAASGGLDVQQLKGEYVALQQEAAALLKEMEIFQQLAPDLDCSDDMADLAALCAGRMYSVARRTVDKELYTPTSKATPVARGKGKAVEPVRKPVKPPTGVPTSVNAVAAAMRARSDEALKSAIGDFEGYVRWQRSTAIVADDDEVRTALRKRVIALRSALSKEMAHLPSDAFMHVEHEVLKKTYVNSETMLGDAVSDIPREQFWVSGDGYAWDLDELVQAIKASKGSLRNPLTKEPFSVADIEAIVRHPLGKDVAAVQIEQQKLKHGVRPETVKRLRAMATVLLSDDTENSLLSHAAVDEFLSYVATLPEMEREAIDRLKVPAIDSHTRQPFDDTIGDAVRDARGNRICFHKAGDLLKQAAEYLAKGR